MKILSAFLLLFGLQALVHADPSLSIGTSKLTKQVEKRVFKDPKFSIDAEYPLFVGKALPEVARHFNEQIQDILDTQIAEFIPLVQDNPAAQNRNSGIQIRYQTEWLRREPGPLLSLRFTIYSYVAGAAHPNTSRRTLTFDFKRGQPLALKDLFAAGSDFIKDLNSYCAAQLKKVTEESQADMQARGELVYAEWNLRANGLLISFDDFPHVFGPLEVLVPYQALPSFVMP